MFILFQKWCQFVFCFFFQTKYVNSPPLRKFPSFSIKRSTQENFKIYFWGKIHFVLGLLERDISNHSYAPNKPLTQVLNPLSEKFSVINIVHDKLKHVINGLLPIYIFVSVRPAPSWLVSSIGRALHQYRRGQGSNPVQAGIFYLFIYLFCFFRLSFRNYKS